MGKKQRVSLGKAEIEIDVNVEVNDEDELAMK